MKSSCGEKFQVFENELPNQPSIIADADFVKTLNLICGRSAKMYVFDL